MAFLCCLLRDAICFPLIGSHCRTSFSPYNELFSAPGAIFAKRTLLIFDTCATPRVGEGGSFSELSFDSLRAICLLRVFGNSPLLLSRA